MDQRIEGFWRLEDQLLKELASFCEDLDKTYCAAFAEDAFRDFVAVDDDEDIDELYYVGDFLDAFEPWFVYNWQPGQYEFENPEMELPDQPLIKTFIERTQCALTKDENALIAANLSVPFAFYQVEAVDSEACTMVLRHCADGKVVTACEEEIDDNYEVGDIIVARVVTIDGCILVNGTMDLILPPEALPEVVAFYEEHGEEAKIDDAVRSFYFDLRNEFLEHADCDSCEDHEEELQFVTLNYHLHCTTSEAFEKLYTLCHQDARETLLEDAIKDSEGALKQISFPWLDEEVDFEDEEILAESLLGMISLDEDHLRIEVNSVEYASLMKTYIEELLGDVAHLESETIDSIEDVLGMCEEKEEGLVQQ